MKHKVERVNKAFPWLYYILSGIMIGGVWPPLPFGLLITVAFVPFLFAIEHTKNIRHVFLGSLLTFFIWGSITMYWVLNITTANTDYVLILTGFIIIPLFMTTPILLVSFIRRYIGSINTWLILPFFWVGYEYFIANWEFSFNWLALGLSLSLFPSIIQFYSITGTIGGSFLIFSVNIIILLILINWSDNSKKRNVLIATLSLLIIIIGIGNFLLKQQQTFVRQKVKVATMQPNFDSYEDLSSSSLFEQISILELMGAKLEGRGIDLIVVSEGFLNGYGEERIIINKLDSSKAVKRIKKLSQKINSAILTGFIGYIIYPDQEHSTVSSVPIIKGLYADAFNAAMLITPNGPTQFYTKTKLVPFMERVPFLSKFGFMEKLRLSLNKAKASYGILEDQSTLQYKKLSIIPVICQETLYPDYVRQFANKRGNMIAIMSNDSWAGNTSGYRQNATYATPLAIQMNKAIARSGNTGISLFTDNHGKIIDKTKWNERDILIGEISLNNRDSFYSQHGDYFGRISLAVSIIILVLTGIKAIRDRLLQS